MSEQGGDATIPISEPGCATARPITVVTGGTEGIGLAIAREFARHGHDLMLVARSREKLDQVMNEFRQAFAVNVDTIAADLSTRVGRQAVQDAVQDRGRWVEFLVNNAGIGYATLFAKAEPERLDAIIDLNVAALTDLTRRFLPDMIARRRGGVLNLGSLAGFAPGPYQQTYYASKAYVISLTQAIAHETRATGVRVAVVTPGPVDTRFHARMGTQHALYLLFGLMQPETVASAAYVEFMRGRRVIVPGILNKLNHILLQLLPRFLLVPFMGLVLKQRPWSAVQFEEIGGNS